MHYIGLSNGKFVATRTTYGVKPHWMNNPMRSSGPSNRRGPMYSLCRLSLHTLYPNPLSCNLQHSYGANSLHKA